LGADEDVKKYFTSDYVYKKDKIEVLEKKLKPYFSRETYAFISILAERDRMDILPDIVSLYKEVSDEYDDIINVKIIASDKIDEETLDSIIETVKYFSGCEVNYTVEIDKSIIGGIKVYVGSMLYDYSVKTQIDRLQNEFINGAYRKIF